jgi:geranylgeranylglycerol-phosphate geranylgeranyltransferase
MRRRVIAHVETWRPYTLGYPGLVTLAGAVLAYPHASAWRLCGAWAAVTLGWLGGQYGGDYFDRELDAIAKPHRPIPSGRMSAGEARAGLALCVSLGAVIAVTLSWRTVLIAAAVLAGGIAYSKWLKGIGFAGNVMRGALTAAAFLFGCVAVRGAFPPGALFLIMAAFWVHDTSSNLVGTFRDIDGDRAGGYRTLAVQFGPGWSLACVAVLSAIWISLAVVGSVRYTGAPGFPAGTGLIVAACAAGLAALILLVRARPPLARATALRAHQFLATGRVLLAGGFILLGRDTVPVIVIIASVVVLTTILQPVMRSRYEFGQSGSPSIPEPEKGGTYAVN